MAIDNKNYAIEINGLRKIYNHKKPNAFEALNHKLTKFTMFLKHWEI